MRTSAIIITLFIAIASFAQPKVSGKGDCFCDNIKKSGVWYLGPASAYGINAYSSDYGGDATSQYAIGLRGGTNITPELSFQVGAFYSRITSPVMGDTSSGIATPTEYLPTSWDRSTILVPVHLAYRFNGLTRFIPYVSAGVVNEFLLKDHPSDLEKTDTAYDKTGGYQAAYLDLAPGVAFALSDKASIYLEAYYRHSILDLFSKSEQTDNYTKQLGVGIGFNFHL